MTMFEPRIRGASVRLVLTLAQSATKEEPTGDNATIFTMVYAPQSGLVPTIKLACLGGPAAAGVVVPREPSTRHMAPYTNAPLCSSQVPGGLAMAGLDQLEGHARVWSNTPKTLAFPSGILKYPWHPPTTALEPKDSDISILWYFLWSCAPRQDVKRYPQPSTQLLQQSPILSMDVHYLRRRGSRPCDGGHPRSVLHQVSHHEGPWMGGL